ncbi:MAG: phosphate ABC transporter permease PstA [Gammaproteobacteria bacterium]|nr:phosphate ABC transporter permease PstA [Gammaproteobacteria bacterium]
MKPSPIRAIRNHVFTGFCYVAAAFSLFMLCSILYTLVLRGAGSIHVSLFTQATPPPGQPGGISNAIIGSLMMTGLAILVAAPIGILIATFLVEFSGRKKLAASIRFINDVLLSAPSIVTGLFVYGLVVKTTGHFSGLAGAIALAFIAIPMIVRSTEDVLYLISPMLKESAVALGIPRWRVILTIVYRAARDGIITAVLLAMARIAGETAPLLFTALNNQFSSANLLRPIANLPVVIFQYAMSPYQNWQDLAWGGALIITLSILVLNLVARYISKR